MTGFHLVKRTNISHLVNWREKQIIEMKAGPSIAGCRAAKGDAKEAQKKKPQTSSERDSKPRPVFTCIVQYSRTVMGFFGALFAAA